MTSNTERGRPGRSTVADRVILFMAQGFFIGRIPFMPGTFGSILGVAWTALLLGCQSAWCYVVLSLVGIPLSVWFCGRAERILGQTDPGSVVLDEIVAMPICFGAWIGAYAWAHGDLPHPGWLFTWPNAAWTVGIFLGFRVFDIVKPWPVRQSQSLPGGLGVTVDDVLAALYVNAIVLLVRTATA